MPEILINVINKIPQLSGDVRQITADNTDYTIRFVFDDDWQEGEKRVYFVRENGFAYPIGKTAEDITPVPSVNGVKLRTCLFVGVQQGAVKTSRPCMIPVYRSITDMIDDDAVQPDPSLWEDIVSRIIALEESGGSAGEGGAVYVLEEGESLDDVPEEYDLAYDPYAEDDAEEDGPTIDGGGSAPGTGEPGEDGYSIYQSTEERDDAGSDTISRADATAVILGGRTLRTNDFVILSHYLYRVVEINDFYFEGELVANLKGDPGQPGTTPHIGANGNWYIGDTDTGVKAQGEPGAKGDPGEPGQPGEPGSDYILTEADKSEIAQEAAGLIDTALLSIIGEVTE